MTHDVAGPSVASLGSVTLLASVAALLLSGWTLYRTRQLDATDWAFAHANSRNTDVVCDLIKETQVLRGRIEALERQAEGNQ
jgi:hypothetical protein